MTLAQLRALAKTLYYTATHATDIDDTQWLQLLNAGSRAIFLEIAKLYPEQFATRYNSTSMANTVITIPFATINAGGCHRIIGVYVGTAASPKLPLRGLERPLDAMMYDPAAAAPILPARWWVEGTTLYVTPAPSGAWYATRAFIAPPTDMAADADTPWANILPMHHDKIASLACILASAGSDNKMEAYGAFFEYLRESLRAELGESLSDIGRKPPSAVPGMLPSGGKV